MATPIKDLYQSTLGRNADAGGLEYWRGQMDSGMSTNDIGKAMAESTEGKAFSDSGVAQSPSPVYTKDFDGPDYIADSRQAQGLLAGATGKVGSNYSGGSTDNQFITNLYGQEAGRTADADGRAWYQAQLDNGASRQSLVDLFNQSAEGRGFDSYVAPKEAAGNPYTPSPAAEAKTGEVTTVSDRMNKLLDENSDYIKLARTQSAQGMNSKGLLNSSIAVGAGQAAAIDRAMPIATGDANAMNAMQTFNAGEENRMSVFNKTQIDSALASNSDQAFRAELQKGVDSINMYSNELSRQTQLDGLSYDVFSSAINSGIYADTGDVIADQKRIDGFWTEISQIIPDAGRPVIEAAIDQASLAVI